MSACMLPSVRAIVRSCVRLYVLVSMSVCLFAFLRACVCVCV